MSVEKLLPQSVEAEEGVLGSLLIDPAAVVQVVTFLRSEDFYREIHRVIYAAICDLWRERTPADVITLCDELRRRGKLEEIGGTSAVSSLANLVPTSANVEHYARIVERTAVLRRLIHAAGQIAAVAYNQEDDAVSQAYQLVRGASERRGNQDSVPVEAVVDAFLDEQVMAMREGITLGVQFQLRQLRDALTGLKPGELLYLCGRPGSGKSVLAATLAWQEAERLKQEGHGCVEYITLEMKATQVIGRILASFAEVDTRTIRANFKRYDGTIDEAAWAAVRKAGRDVKERMAGRLRWMDRPVKPADIRAHLEYAVAERGCSLVVIDYIGIVTPDDNARKQTEYQRITDLSRELKQLALELRIPIICLVQMSRQSEYRSNPRPTKSDLRDSGSLEQDGDFILGIYRGAEYMQKTAQADSQFAQFAELHILKAREARNQVVIPLRFEGHYTRMQDWPANWKYEHYLTLTPNDDNKQSGNAPEDYEAW